MMNLSVRTEQVVGERATVSWYVGMENHGLLDIDLGNVDRDHSIVAELCAIRYLVFMKSVFNVVPKFGRGIQIQVTSGAVKKLINGTSTKKHLRTYALFTRPRLDQAIFLVSKKALSLDVSIQPTEQVRLNDVFASWFEPFCIQGLGNIHITNHAAERYTQRLNQPELKDPMESLLHRLMHEKFCQQPIPARVLAHKARKYGNSQHIEVWGHPEATMRFLIARDQPEQGTLLTVFRIDPEQRSL